MQCVVCIKIDCAHKLFVRMLIIINITKALIVYGEKNLTSD